MWKGVEKMVGKTDKKGAKEKRKVSENLVLVLLVPALFLLTIGTYLVFGRLAERYPAICKYLGRHWLVERATEDNPNPRVGCYTWDELYE